MLMIFADGAGDLLGLLQRQQDTVYRVALARCGNRSDAEDITQEVFLRYLNNSPVFENPEHEKAWCIRTAINASKNLLHSAWLRHTQPLDEQENSLVWNDPEDKGVYDAVMSLPEAYRTAVYLFYYEGYSVQEVAKMTGSRVSAVTTRLERARKKLRELLKEDIL